MNTNTSMNPMHTAMRGAPAVVAWFVGAYFVNSRPAAAVIANNAAGGMTKPSNAAA